MSRQRFVIAALIVACLIPAFMMPDAADGAGRKKGNFFISFHVEGDKSLGERRVAVDKINGREVYFKRTPSITHKHFNGYWPFPADDGTWGAVFRLNSTGQRRMNTVGLTERGRLVRVVVNMRLVDVMEIDGAPKDGLVVVWKGFSEQELAQIEKTIPQLGE